MTPLFFHYTWRETRYPVPGPSSDVQLQTEDDGHHKNNDNIDLHSSLESSN